MPDAFTADVLSARRPVWDALSTLFLDADVPSSLTSRAQRLAESPYTLADLERILLDEVWPVCAPNLFTMAGEWAGFDRDWLEAQILERRRTGRRGFPWRSPRRLAVRCWPDWRRTRAAVAAGRVAAGWPGHLDLA